MATKETLPKDLAEFHKKAIILKDYRLVTVEVIYHLPDHPDILQSFIWQERDLLPDFPNLKKFLKYWQAHIEGAIHSVMVDNKEDGLAGDYGFALADLPLIH